VVGWPASFGTTVRASRAFIPGLALFANIVVDNSETQLSLSLRVPNDVPNDVSCGPPALSDNTYLIYDLSYR